MEGRYRMLLEGAPDVMVVVNQQGEVVLLNLQAEKQFGFHRDELVGRPVTTIIPEGFAERVLSDGRRSVEEALAQTIGTGMELNARRKDGSTFPVEIMLSPLDGPDGLVVTVAIRDITARRQAETHLQQTIDELHRSNEELRQFAYVASHDLQEPLRMVASFTQLLSRRYKGKLDADADDFIAYAVDGAARMQQLIDDLLLYSRIGAQGQDRTDISCDEALEQALMNLQAATHESGATVTHGPLPVVHGNRMQLIQLFQNLVGNAIKYRGASPPVVHVAAVPSGDGQWTVSVEDNGLGIEGQYFEKIFGVFQRLHTRREFSGTGIGLAICKKIVERHGGTITVRSEVGRGSTFVFSLDAAAGGAP